MTFDLLTFSPYTGCGNFCSIIVDIYPTSIFVTFVVKALVVTTLIAATAFVVGAAFVVAIAFVVATAFGLKTIYLL